MPQYYIWTIGCQMNKAETERLDSFFKGQGYQSTKSADKADIIVLNSCVVRQNAENRIINKLKNFKPLKKTSPGITLAVTGCLVDSDIEQLVKTFPYVDHFFKPGEPPPWLDGIDSRHFTPLQPSPSTFVPIIQGCDNFCSYCIVPYRRGRENSRPLDEIVCEVKELIRRGVKEIILLGQNVDSYGHDLPDKPELADLLEELNTIEGLARIRFLTNHPKDMNQRLIDSIANIDKVCEHIHIPLQSGDNDILKAMRRGYTAERYCELIKEIRYKIPNVALSTDVIVGFPSESKSQFQHTFDLLSEIRFDTVHIAAYSPRPGTIAARELDDNVPVNEKMERFNKIERLQKRIAAEINDELLGKTVEVLVENKEKDKWKGRTRSDKLVFFHKDNDYLGQIVKIRIEKASPWSLQGKIESFLQGGAMKRSKLLYLGLITTLMISLLVLSGCIPSETPAGDEGGFPWQTIMLLAVLFGLMYLILIRPQRKKQKEHQQLVSELKRGDKVITAGGIYGQIESVSEDTVVLKIDSNTTAKVAKSSVALRREGSTF